MQPYARVVAHSVNSAGCEVATIEVVLHRFVLAEANTHRTLVKSSASSRAIPVNVQLDRIADGGGEPVSWPSAEQPGMQGGAELTGADLAAAQEFYQAVRKSVSTATRAYLDGHPDKSTRLHKSVTNRLIEPFMLHKVLFTGTAWENFFALRCHPDAQPEIRHAAEMMQDAYQRSTPVPVADGDWHLPYIDRQDRDACDGDTATLVRASVARAARTSHFLVSGERDLGKDRGLYDRLVTAVPMHAAPLEHVAKADPGNMHTVALDGVTIDGDPYHHELVLPRHGALLGWRTHRAEVEASQPYQSFA